MAQIRLKIADHTETLELDRATRADGVQIIRLEGESIEVEVEHLRPGAGRLRIQGRVIPFHWVRRQDGLEVWVAGTTARLGIASPAKRRAGGAGPAATSAHTIPAPMPGTILKVHVRPGDSFEAHDALIVMESMKMEMTLSAPQAGRVKEILCRPGELVELGAVLLRSEEIASRDGPS